MTARALARTLLIGVGAYAIIKGFELLQPLTWVLPAWGARHDSQTSILVRAVLYSLIVPLVLFFLGGLLIVRPPRYLFPKRIDGETQATLTIRTILPAGAFLIGVLILCGVAPKIFNLVVTYAMAGEYDIKSILAYRWGRAISLVVQLILGVYLLLGAPHLVQWELRRLKVTDTPSDDGASPGGVDTEGSK
jgi:hypothetical protein